MEKGNRANFGSKMGILLATAGSAVGLGNIWRFPYQAGTNGGGAFLLVYVLCVLLVCLPVMVAEFMIGRHSQANTGSAYKLVAPRRHWGFVGKLGVLAGTLILCYYGVVAGWTLDYLLQALVGTFGRMAAGSGGNGQVFSDYFNNFVSNPWRPIVCMALFMLCSHFILVRGVQKGIERFSNILMPMLFVLLLLLAGCALTLPGCAEGLTFLFKPDFGKINSGVVLAAMAQAFFSLSLAMGCLCTYASYFKSDANLMKTACNVGIIDTLVAILAGVVIFPTIFTVGIHPGQGPSLVFVALPNVFQQAMGGMPVLAYLCSVMFYALLVVATLTSVISLHEVGTAYLAETRHLSRNKAAGIITAFCIALGVLCSLSMGPLKNLTLAGMNIFDLFDFVTAKLMLPIGGMLTAVFVGWVLSKRIIWSELTNRGTKRMPFFIPFFFLLKYVAPISIMCIFLNELGLFSWL